MIRSHLSHNVPTTSRQRPDNVPTTSQQSPNEDLINYQGNASVLQGLVGLCAKNVAIILYIHLQYGIKKCFKITNVSIS